jgi:hypothetical protein
MNEHFNDMKEYYLNYTKESLIKDGYIVPSFAIFAYKTSDNFPAMIQMPIPGSFLESDESKENFINNVFPLMAEQVRKEFKPFAILWSSEAYFRETSADFDLEKNDFRDIPIKKEILIITIDTAENNEVKLYDIKRNGMTVNNEGLVDSIEISVMEEEVNSSDFSGRFSNLYKKLMGEL